MPSASAQGQFASIPDQWSEWNADTTVHNGQSTENRGAFAADLAAGETLAFDAAKTARMEQENRESRASNQNFAEIPDFSGWNEGKEWSDTPSDAQRAGFASDLTEEQTRKTLK